MTKNIYQENSRYGPQTEVGVLTAPTIGQFGLGSYRWRMGARVERQQLCTICSIYIYKVNLLL